ncbi:MAG: tyrosine-type recombinase/integrase [Candidatus Zixiibacteriota bacterium]
MARIYKRGSIWYIDYIVNGERVRKSVGKSKRVAELTLKDVEVKLSKGELGTVKDDHPISDFFQEYLVFSKTNHSHKTFIRYKAIIDHFLWFLDQHPRIRTLSDLKPKLFEDYKTWRRTQYVMPNGQPISLQKPIPKTAKLGAKSNTINMEVKVLRTIFNEAIKWEYLKENPTKDVKMLKVTDAKKPRFLTEEECRKLLAECGKELYPIFFTFLNTGMRLSELLNLTWDDIDFRRKKIKIQAKSFWHPKTGEREIPMNEGMEELLINLRKEDKKTSQFIFHQKDGTKLRDNYLRKKLIVITKACGFPDVTKIHSLRHTFASYLVMNGVDLPTVQKLMGHSDIQTTMIYSHLAPDHLVAAVGKLQFGSDESGDE